MRVFQNNRPISPISNEPTIPVILRGKKKQFQKSANPKSQQKFQPQNLIPKTNPIVVYPVTNIQNIPAQSSVTNRAVSHFRSISVPHVTRVIHPPQPFIEVRPNVTINRPISIQKVTRPVNYNKNVEKDHVRKCLDESLNQIYGILNQKRLSLDLKNIKSQSVQLTAPRLQKKLVQQYIQLIYKDYSIPDPFANPSNIKHRNLNEGNLQDRLSYIQQSVATEPNRKQRKKGQSVMSGSTNKKAVQLKQSFLIQMFSPAQLPSSASNKKPATQNNSYSRSRYSGNQINLPHPFHTTGHLAEISQYSQRQVKQTYRFCFICQQPILEANIDLHEHQKCPQFAHLYQMNFIQIRETLIRKILRIKKQIQQIHNQIFNENDEDCVKRKLEALKKQSKNYLKIIDTNIWQQKLNKQKMKHPSKWKADVSFNFSSVMKCYEQNYFKMYEYFRKLHWFVLMFKNLEEKYGIQSNNSFDFVDQQRKNSRQTQLVDSRRFSIPY